MAIKLKPDYAEAHNNLGNALFAKRKIEEAISHYKMAIKFKPDYANAHNNLGIALFYAKMTEQPLIISKKQLEYGLTTPTHITILEMLCSAKGRKE